MLERLKLWNVVIYYADGWEAYAELLPEEKLEQTKAETHGIERNNFRQRHWFARFRRKTCVVSRAIQMVEITMGLFARFRVNGGPELISAFFN